MKRVLFIQNGEQDHPGLFATVLRDHGIALDIVNAGCGESTPTELDRWAAIAVGGGGMSAYETERYPFLREEETLIRSARAAGKPLLGMCLGAQLMAGALGGKVFPNRAKEIGFHDVRFMPAAENDSIWAGCTATFQPVQWHGDTFSLPPGAVLLASSDLTENQLFRLDDASYGLQFHLEIDEPVLTEMVETDDGWLPQNGVDPQQFLREARLAIPKVEPVARAVFGPMGGTAAVNEDLSLNTKTAHSYFNAYAAAAGLGGRCAGFVLELSARCQLLAASCLQLAPFARPLADCASFRSKGFGWHPRDSHALTIECLVHNESER